MQSLDLLKNIPINLGLYFHEITQQIYQDPRFVELQQLLSNKDNLNKYIYSLYSDTNLLTNNLFMPIFHSVYLASGQSNIIIESDNDLWLLGAFPNNLYFYMGDSDEEIRKNPRIKIIKSITEIGGV